MGLLDNLENQALGSFLGGSSSPLASNILQMIQNQPGGLQGLVQSFHDKGLGGVVSSWVSTGQNLPISADQIHQVLGSDKVKQLAAAAGISPDMGQARPSHNYCQRLWINLHPTAKLGTTAVSWTWWVDC